MTSHQVFQVADDVIAREVAGEMVLLDLASGLYFGLDPVGSRAWQRLSEHAACLTDLVDIIEAEYDAPRAVIEQDLAKLLDHLLERRLIEIAPAV